MSSEHLDHDVTPRCTARSPLFDAHCERAPGHGPPHTGKGFYWTGAVEATFDELPALPTVKLPSNKLPGRLAVALMVSCWCSGYVSGAAARRRS